VAIDPVSPSTLYVVGPTASGSSGVFKSTDGGATFAPMSKGLSRSFFGSLLIDPRNTAQIYLGGNSPRDSDAFVTKINQSGSALVYSTLLGGDPDPNDSSGAGDIGLGIAVDSVGHAFVTGFTRSLNFPTTPDVFQPLSVGTSFISKLIPSYVISGIVVGENGLPISGADVTLSGAQLSSFRTAGDGSYFFSPLKEGDSFTISAAKSGFTFTPPSQSFSNLNSNQIVNFVAHPTNAPFFAINGRVTSNGAALKDVSITLGGSQAGLMTTNANGDYSFTVPGGGNYTITPATVGYSFNPSIQTFNNLSGNQTADFSATRLNLVVTNANDAGAGSLRQALLDANSI
jgi:hypothetical protein